MHAVDMNSMDVGRMLGLRPRFLPEPTLAGRGRPSQRRVAISDRCRARGLARLPHARFTPHGCARRVQAHLVYLTYSSIRRGRATAHPAATRIASLPADLALYPGRIHLRVAQDAPTAVLVCQAAGAPVSGPDYRQEPRAVTAVPRGTSSESGTRGLTPLQGRLASRSTPPRAVSTASSPVLVEKRLLCPANFRELRASTSLAARRTSDERSRSPPRMPS